MRICPKNLPVIKDYACNGRIVFVDTETTGGGCDDEICQLAAVEYVGGNRTRSLNMYIKPTCEMNPWAENIHGISMDFLDVHGIDPVEAMHRFFEFLGENVLFVAHNVPFDLGMIQRECRKFDIAYEPTGVETCDSVILARRLRPDLPSHALGKLIESLGIEGVNSHDAFDDVLACAGVFFHLVAMLD